RLGLHHAGGVLHLGADARPVEGRVVCAVRRLPVAPANRVRQGRAVSAVPDAALHPVDRGAGHYDTPRPRASGVDEALPARRAVTYLVLLAEDVIVARRLPPSPEKGLLASSFFGFLTSSLDFCLSPFP